MVFQKYGFISEAIPSFSKVDDSAQVLHGRVWNYYIEEILQPPESPKKPEDLQTQLELHSDYQLPLT